MKDSIVRRLPLSAELVEGGVHFRVWAPRSSRVSVVLFDNVKKGPVRDQLLVSEGKGYFGGLVHGIGAGQLYKFQLDQGCFPDPASRFQPDGPHGPSQVIDPSAFVWSDRDWKGVGPQNQVLYEMHVGTFSRESTFRGVQQQLPHLTELGVTVIEMMPIADFPGRYGWGYDGVNLYAPSRLYGSPDDLRALIDAAHRVGIGVILDVVYNHLGPDGNFLKEFSPHYFSSTHDNDWGDAINFDGDDSGPVREFFCSNAEYWIREFHFDGLRLDATQQIYDDSPEHIMELITRRVRMAACGKETLIVGENEPQHTRLVRSPERGGLGLDALWNDDFHHSAIVALTGRTEAYYTDYKGTPQEFISTAKWGYLYQGQYYSWQKAPRGTPAFDLEPWNFVNFIQNHDQIANSLRGDRVHSMGSPGAVRAMTALLLLSPGTPMLFQGQEFAASSRFLYFADHNPELAKLVASGRETFLKQFPSLDHPEARKILQNPESVETFMSCKLDFANKEDHRPVFELHRDLIRLRRADPVIGRARRGTVDGAVLQNESFILRYFEEHGDDRLLLINLGKNLKLNIAPEPLLAPPEGKQWKQIFNSEDIRYGGNGMPAFDADGAWQFPGQVAVLMKAVSETDSL